MVDITPDIFRSIVSRPGLPGESADAIRMTSIEGRISDVEDLALPPTSAIVAGLYYGPLTTLSGWVGPLTEQLAIANYLYAVPFLCPQTAIFDQVGIEVTTPVAGGTIRLGLYSVNSAGMPDALAYDWGTVDASVAGWRSIPIGGAFGLEGIIPRGLYWLAGARNATIGTRAITSRAGMTATLGYVGTDGTTPRSALYRTLAAGFTALPTTFGPVTTVFSIPAFQLRAT